ncbi:hypothetical protein NW754_011857 [Fusarium falciforme]|nr:hypothetical protein NW754_011857 [Fusarium falciforme]KAJ4201860.1 hypothetical protein NW767_006397 [Fusarium falciforme]
MISSTIFLGLLGLAAASPLAPRPGYVEPHIVTNPRYPDRSTSTGFKLIVNVTDHSKDFDPPINNYEITTIHVGAGLSLVGVVEQDGRVFYQNGTKDQRQDGEATVLTDGGTPLTPAGLAIQQNKENKQLYDASLNFGPGTPGVQLNALDDPYTYMLPETFVACDESLEYYQGKHFIVIKQARLSIDENNEIQRNIPDGCAPIRLVPQCAELEEVPEGSYSSHEFALDSKCYNDVAKIKWEQYSP